MIAACPFPAPRGTQICIQGLAAQLAQAGHQVHLVSYARYHAHRFEAVETLKPYRHHFAEGLSVRAQSGWQWRKLVADVFLYRMCRYLLRQMRFDVLHAHHIEGLAIGVALRRFYRVPLVAHMHTDLVAEVPSYSCKRYVGTALGRLAGVTEAQLLQHADYGLALNSNDAMRLKLCVQAECVYPALALEKPLLRLKKHVHRPYLIYSGNADAYQNLPFLLAAWSRIYPQLSSYRLLIATHQAGPHWRAAETCPGVEVMVVGSFEQMQGLIRGGVLALCARQLCGGFPVKWINYWSAQTPMVAIQKTGQSVFGPDFEIVARNLAFWSTACCDAFAMRVCDAVQDKTMQQHCVAQAQVFVEQARARYVPAIEQAYGQAEILFKRKQKKQNLQMHGF